MRSKVVDRNKMTEYKKGIDRHKKDIEKTVVKAKTNDVVKAKIDNEVIINKKKKVSKKKPSKESIEEIERRAEEKAYEGIVSEKEFHEEEPKYEISKEERAERFNKLHELAVQMSNRWKEENKSVTKSDI